MQGLTDPATPDQIVQRATLVTHLTIIADLDRHLHTTRLVRRTGRPRMQLSREPQAIQRPCVFLSNLGQGSHRNARQPRGGIQADIRGKVFL